MSHLALIPDDSAARRTLEYARTIFEGDGIVFEDMVVADHQLPVTDRRGRRLDKEFQHTPEPLLRSWRSARRLMAHTKPGDVLLASDHSGLCGVFALMQRSLPAEERRDLWTLAADSRYLQLRVTASAHSGLPLPLDFILDWEITQYRHSDRVLATSPRARAELSRIGVAAQLLSPRAEDAAPLSGRARSWWVPGPVSRLNQTGEVLRALTSVSDVTATLSNEDADDEIWTGSTWEALRHSRDLLDDRVARAGQAPDDTDVTVLGNPLTAPPSVTHPVVVPKESVASLVWPGAPQWTEADDLAEILSGRAMPPALREHGDKDVDLVPPLEGGPAERSEAEGGSGAMVSPAQRISVGVPVFRDVRFLDECLNSILAQTTPPAEIVVVDDGSASAEVDDALDRWVKKDHRIRVLRGPHRGVCVARNRALELMTGDAFAFIDSDDTWEPEFLEHCATMLRGDDSLWAVATWTRFFGAYEAVEAKPPFDARTGSRENPIISTAALVDMKVRELGIRFQPDLAFLFCEDWHVWSQIVAAGGRIGLVPEPLANHRVHESSGGYLRTELAHALGKTRATEPLRV